MELTQSFFLRTNIKEKLGNLNFNNMKNVETRHEILEYVNVMDNFTVGNEIQNMKDYLLAFKVEDMRLSIKQGSGKRARVC